MVKYVRFLGVMICALALFLSCDDKKAGNQDGKDIRLSGYVQDEYGMPIPGVSVNLADKVIYTDEEGHFSLSNPVVSGNRYVIKFEKEDYFDFLYSKEVDDTTGVLIVMSRYGNSDYTRQVRFSAMDGVTVNVRGMIVDIPGEGLVREDGSLYEGEVLMNVLYLNPEEKNFRQQMPGGDLLAIRSNQDTTSLISYGMVNVIMKDDKGGKLQLREGAPAELSYPIPPSLLSIAKDTLPLWFFDEAKGMWIEEGYALKKGGRYEGVVKHFSWWNGDQPTVSARVHLSLVDAKGMPVPYAVVNVQHLCVERFRLDGNGRAFGYVPMDQPVTFTVGEEVVGNLPPMPGGEEVTYVCKLSDEVGAKHILVVDSDGKPMPRFKLCVLGRDTSANGRWLLWSRAEGQWETDDNGVISVCIMKELLYQLEISRLSYTYFSYLFTYDDFDEKGYIKVVVPTKFVHLTGTMKGDSYSSQFIVRDDNNDNIQMEPCTFDVREDGSYNIWLVPDRKYVVTCCNVLVGEVDLTKENGDSVVRKDFDFSLVKVINSQGIVPEYDLFIGQHNGYQYVTYSPERFSKSYRMSGKPQEAVVEYMDGQVVKAFEKKGDYFMPITVDIAKDIPTVGTLTLYPEDGAPESVYMDLCDDASVSMGLAKILFRNVSMEIPHYSQQDKRHQASVKVRDYGFDNCKLRIKSRGENAVDMVVRGKGLSKDGAKKARVEGKFKVPALYMGPCQKWSDLCLSKSIPELSTPIDVAYQFCKSGISYTQLCYRKAGKATVEQLVEAFKAEGYTNCVTNQKTEGVTEYSFVKESDGVEIQVKVKYRADGAIPQKEMSSQFTYLFGDGYVDADAGIVPDESCKCNMLVAISYLSKENRQRLAWKMLRKN